MENVLIKPYEISVWENILVSEGDSSYYKENKIAIIGSDTMNGPSSIYEPVFLKRANGEKTLSFSLKYKYFDPYSENEEVINPFADLLVNERKVKLNYDGEWYEFIVKDHTEGSEDYTWTYTCTDAYVLELSKNGYNLTFDAELNNNQGTAVELARKVVENTDWQVADDSKVGPQYVEEPIYKATIKSVAEIDFFNVDEGTTAIFEAEQEIYLFYSYINNKNGQYVQFIEYDEDKNYTIDSKNVITDTNYRILNLLEYKEDGFYFNNVCIIEFGELETRYQANRLAYNQLTTYDPVMQRTVDIFESNDKQKIYRYKDYLYTTSNVVTNLITNGENFNALEDGTLQGWNPYTDQEGGKKVNKLELVTYPEIGEGKKLVDINLLSAIEGYMKTTFNGAMTANYENTIYNSGFENNTSIIQSVAKGDRFVLRWRAGRSENQGDPYDVGNLESYSGIRALVARYSQDEVTRFGYYYKHIDKNNIVMEFKGTPEILNNYVRGGSLRIEYLLTEDTSFVEGKEYYEYDEELEEYVLTEDISFIEGKEYFEKNTSYVIDGVVQEPSTRYIYVDTATSSEYIWDGSTGEFIPKTDENYLPYYYLVAEAKKVLPNSYLTDPTKKYGIFIYTNENTLTENIIIEKAANTSTTATEKVPGRENSQIIVYLSDGDAAVATFNVGTDGQVVVDSTTIIYDAKQETITFTKNSAIEYYKIVYSVLVPIYIQDIQLTRYIEDANEKPILIGNTPVATSVLTDYYYVKPLDGMVAEDVVTYTDLEKLQEEVGISTVVPVYNEDSQKVLTISESKSNCFNILQSIAETFECWIELDVEHDERGTIVVENGRPRKFVRLNEYAGKDNFAGFKYGINLDTIQRTVNSDEIVTKLIVDQSQSDYADEGFISISSAKSNPTRESYILNFDYYYGQGLLDRDKAEADRMVFVTDISGVNEVLIEMEQKRRDLESALTSISSQRNVYSTLIDSAKEKKSIALGDFQDLTGMSYEEYKQKQEEAVIYENKFYNKTTDEVVIKGKAYYTYDENTGIITKVEVINPDARPADRWYELLPDYSEEETMYDILADIYTSSAMINNYSGLFSNKDKEYRDKDRELNGDKDYSLKVWTAIDEHDERHVILSLDNYFLGFEVDFLQVVEDVESRNPKEEGWYERVDDKYVLTEDTQPVSGKTYYAADSWISDLNNKYYDKTTHVTLLGFAPPQNYSMEKYWYEIVDGVTESFSITYVGEDRVEGLVHEIDEKREKKEAILSAFNNKYRRFIQEGTWSSTDYISSELYYLDALQVSNTSAQPIISYDINVVEISQLEGFEWYLFDAGDKTYVEDTEFFGWSLQNGVLTPAREEVIVSEVEWHLEEPDQNKITVQNYKSRFEDFFQRVSATVQTVQYNEATYAKISSLLDENGTINEDVLVASMNRIGGKEYVLTSDGSVIIDGNTILIQNLTNPANRVILNSEGIQISEDGGENYRTAISGHGINIGEVYTGFLNTDNIVIGSKDYPSFRWDKSGISAYKSTNDETKPYDLKTYVRFDEYGLYGIKRDDAESFKARSLDDVKNNAHFAVTWDGFFIKNSYTGGGRVEITSDNDFRVLKANDIETIKIGALEWTQGGVVTETPISGVAPSLYGIRIKNALGTGNVFKADSEGNLEITGTVYANAGEIGGMSVDNDRLKMDYIIFRPGTGIYSIYPYHEENVNNPISAYPFWIKDTDGSAIFNNVTVRGSIKTSVFEYEEIQAVGGAFMFRPSSAIRDAEVDGEDLVITVDKPNIIRDGAWYKLSNYIDDESAVGAYGLVHIYQVNKINNEIRLLGGAAILEIVNINDIAGGSIIDMGYEPNTYEPVSLIPESNPHQLGLYELINNEYVLTADEEVDESKTYYEELYKNGANNYGIGINSSDNFINLPPRAISLFETKVNHTQDPKVSYIYKGILGTLPDERLNNLNVDSDIYQYMRDTQGIYTDNMYLGNNDQYLAFYTDKNDNNKKHLTIKADSIMYVFENEDVPLDNLVKYIWYDNAAAHVAAGKVSAEFNRNNEKTYGFNSLLNSSGIYFRYDDQIKALYGVDGIKLYGGASSENSSPSLDIGSDRIIVGKKSGLHIEIDSGELGFYNAYGEGEDRERFRVSYINDSKLYIPYSVVLNEMIVGEQENDLGEKTQLWAWSIAGQNHLRLVWKGGEVEE